MMYLPKAYKFTYGYNISLYYPKLSLPCGQTNIKIEDGLSDIVTLVGQQTDRMKSAKVAGNMLSHIRVAGNTPWRHYGVAGMKLCNIALVRSPRLIISGR